MRSLYLNVLQKAESSGVPIISHEALLTLEHVFAFFPVPRKEDVDHEVRFMINTILGRENAGSEGRTKC